MAVASLANLGPVGSNMVPNFWADFLRDQLFPQLYFRQLGTKVVVPPGYGNTIKIPRWKTAIKQSATWAGTTDLSGALTAVGYMNETAMGSNTNTLSPESISGFITAWDGYYQYSDRSVLVSYTDYVKGAVKELGRQLAVRLDNFTRDRITAAGFIRTTGGVIGTAKTRSTNALQGKYVAKIAPTMEGYNVPAWDDETYVAVINPFAKYDMFADVSSNSFVAVHQYGDPSMAYRGEIGSMFGTRFLTTTAVPKFAGTGSTSGTNGLSPGVTGAYAWVFAPDAFYVAEHAQGGFDVIHHPPGSSGALQDPTNKIGSVGIKAYYGVIPNASTDKRLMRLSHGLGLLA